MADMHPASKWKLMVFERVDTLEGGPRFAAQFMGLPLIHTGNDKAKLIQQMEMFRFETIVKNSGKFVKPKKVDRSIMDDSEIAE